MNDIIIYFAVKAQVIGDFLLTEPIKSHTRGFEVAIFIEDGVYKISVIKSVTATSKLNIRLKMTEGFLEPEQPHIPNKEDYKEYIELLQYIEAMGGFNYGITKILYKETLELVWYVGEEVFQNLKQVCIMKPKLNPKEPKILSTSNLSSILLLNKLVPDAIIPYNYYREANSYLENKDYRMAYLHFYMILEYCFSEGKTDRKAQIRNFINDDWLIFSVLDTIKLLKNNDVVLYKWLQDKLLEKNKKFNVHDIIWLLFDYRGILAHGLKRSAKYVFDDEQLRPITRFLGSICFSVCGNMQVYCMSSQENKNKRVDERICVLKDELNVEI